SVSGIPNCFRAATTFAIRSVYWAIAACALEARLVTPSCTIPTSGTARMSALPDTVIEGGSVVCARAAPTGATSNRAVSDNQRAECLICVSSTLLLAVPMVVFLPGCLASHGVPSSIHRLAQAEKLLDAEDLLHLGERDHALSLIH